MRKQIKTRYAVSFLLQILHNSTKFTYTCLVTYIAIFLTLCIFIVPIKFKLKSMVCIKEKKLYYSITLYKLINLNSGYFDFSSSKFKLHYKNGKTKQLKTKDLFPNNESVNFLRHFSLLKLSSALLLGVDAEDVKTQISALISVLNPMIYSVLHQINPYVNFRNDIILLGKNSLSGSALEIIVATNLISIISILFKKVANQIIGGYDGKRKSKQ